MKVNLLAGAALFAIAAAAASLAQSPAGIKRTILQRADVADNREVVLAIAEIAPGHAIGRHTHPGVETGYVIEGESVLEVDGEGAKTLRAGDSYLIPAGRPHDARATGSSPVKVLATYVVEKGQPFAKPAP